MNIVLKIARELTIASKIAMEFNNEEEKKQYQKDHDVRPTTKLEVKKNPKHKVKDELTNKLKKKLNQDEEYLNLAKDPEKNKDILQKMVDEEIRRKKLHKVYHGTHTRKGLMESEAFDKELLGSTTGAGSAKQAFFFAKNMGTAAEYALYEAATPMVGSWFSHPENANEVLGHMRDLVLGGNYSGNLIKPDMKKMPESLWQYYGESVEKFLRAKTPEERLEVYADFRDVDDKTSTKIFEEAMELMEISEEDMDEVAEEIYDEMHEQDIIRHDFDNAWTNAKRNLQNNKNVMMLHEQNPSMKSEEIVALLQQQYPDDEDTAETVKVFNYYLQQKKLKEQSQKNVHYSDLSNEEKQQFKKEHDEEINDKLIEEQKEEVASMLNGIFKHVNTDKYDLSWFEWEDGYDSEQHGIGQYAVNMKKPLIYDFEKKGRWEKFKDIIAQAKKDGYDSVLFKNVADGGGFDDVYAIFEDSQIKSADPVTYDDQNNIIPLNQRFNKENDDMRY